jgi:hypothetical protein
VASYRSEGHVAQESIYERLLFKEDHTKGELLWDNLVDRDAKLYFPVCEAGVMADATAVVDVVVTPSSVQMEGAFPTIRVSLKGVVAALPRHADSMGA